MAARRGLVAARLSRALARECRADVIRRAPCGRRRVSIVVLPASADRLVRVRRQMPDEPHPKGLSSVWLHPATAEALRVTPWRKGRRGAYRLLYPLRIGALGGTPHRVLTAISGVAVFLLGASGAWVWWRGRESSGDAYAVAGIE